MTTTYGELGTPVHLFPWNKLLPFAPLMSPNLTEVCRQVMEFDTLNSSLDINVMFEI